jgi:CO/xanthine dehydrogenase Mo-binding subunit
MARYAGEWVVAVVAESRALAEDAAEFVVVNYDTLTHIVDPEAAMQPDAHLVHPAHGSNVIFQRQFVWGPVEQDMAASDHTLSYKVRWSRSATVPIEGFTTSMGITIPRTSSSYSNSGIGIAALIFVIENQTNPIEDTIWIIVIYKVDTL